MTIETLYASTHIEGDFPNPTNAHGNTPSTWAGSLNDNSSYTSRWGLAAPEHPLTDAATQQFKVVARKGSNSGTPTIQLRLFVNGSLVLTSIVVDIISTTGQNLFISHELAPGDVPSIEVIQSSAGGSPSARNCAQVSLIEWTANTTPDIIEGSIIDVAPAAREERVGGGATDVAPAASDLVEGEVNSWGELVTFTGITDTFYEDSTVVPGQWYRYRVAVADGEVPVSDFTDWVWEQAATQAPSGEISDVAPAASDHAVGEVEADEEVSGAISDVAPVASDHAVGSSGAGIEGNITDGAPVAFDFALVSVLAPPLPAAVPPTLNARSRSKRVRFIST